MAYLKFKACRQLGENIWPISGKLTPKQNTIIKLLINKNTNRKQSDFSKKLQQWKKLAYFYGIRSLNSRLVSKTTLLSRLDKKKSLLLTLETRLDVILVRLYFCSTLFAARQLITHSKIRVNLNVVSLPGFTVRKGDIISMNLHGIVGHIPLKDSPLRVDLRRLRFEPKVQKINWLTERFYSKSVSDVLIPMRNLELMSSYRANRVPCAVSQLSNFEVNYKTFKAVLLYEPIQIHFPYKMDLDLLF